MTGTRRSPRNANAGLDFAAAWHGGMKVLNVLYWDGHASAKTFEEHTHEPDPGPYWTIADDS